MNELGIKVIRFEDEEVMRDIDNVIRSIEGYIEEFEENVRLCL
jgi:very-short-patch-repair endonuclease